MSDINRDDLRELRESIQEQLQIGFEGTQQRQDDTNAWLKRVNGRTGKAEEAIAKLLERTDRQRIDFDEHVKLHEHRRSTDPAATTRPHARGDDARQWERDVKIVLATLTAVGALLGVVWLFVPLFKLLIKAAVS